MSLINEALKRAETEKRLNSSDPAETGASDGAASTDRTAPADSGRRTGWRSAIILGTCVVLAVLTVTYLSLPQTRPNLPPEEVSAESIVPLPTAASAPARSGGDRQAATRPAPEPVVQPAGEDPGAAAPQEPVANFSPEQFNLGGIMESGTGAHAIVNNHLVAVGDEVEGAKVVVIRKYTVVLEKDGKRISLRL